MSEDRAQPDDIANDEAECDNDAGKDKRNRRLDDRHRVILEHSDEAQIVREEKDVYQIHVQGAPANILQCAAERPFFPEPTLIVAEEGKKDDYRRNAQRQADRRILIDDRFTETINQEIKQDADSQEISISEPFLNMNKMFLDQRPKSEEDKVIPALHRKHSLHEFRKRNRIINHLMIDELEKDAQCNKDNITPPLSNAELDDRIENIKIKQHKSEPIALFVVITKLIYD